MAAASSGPGFDVFLSYNWRDREHVHSAETALRNANLRVCVDYQHLTPGRAWIAELEKAIKNSSSVAVFVGANGLGRWQSQEMELALDFGKHIIPVLLPDLKDDPPLGFLRLRTWIDLRVDPLDRLSATIREEHKTDASVFADLCPYRGLAFFREEDADLYFGRESKVEELVTKLRQSHFIAVTGPSGTGKSSLLRAGLARRLRRDREQSWEILTIVPNEEPMIDLGRALAPMVYPREDRIEKSRAIADNLRSGTIPLLDYVREITERTEGLRLLLVVDQFEQLFTISRDADEIKAFIGELLKVSERGMVAVVIAYRAEFHGSVTAHNGLADRLGAGHFILDPMNREQLRAAIEKPAAYAGRSIDSTLTDQLLHDAAVEPGNLPLLEFVLRELWETRHVTLKSYHDLGSLEGALSHYADGVYGKLSSAEKLAARRVFLKTIRVGESGPDTRQRATRIEIGELDWAVVPILAGKRLLVTGDDDCVEICHEALIRHWGELQVWLAADRDFLRWRQRLCIRMEEWEKDRGSLLSGYALARAEEWLASRDADLNSDERRYIRASIAERRRVRVIKRCIFACAVVALLAIVLWWRNEKENRIRAAAENYKVAIEAATTNVKVVEDHLLPEGSEESKAVLARILLRNSLYFFSKVPTSNETPSAAQSRLKLFEALWKNFDNLNDLPNASVAANQEFIIAQHQETSDRSNTVWLRYMILAKEHSGKNGRMMNALSDAEISLKDALRLAEQLWAENAGDESRRELAHAHELLGDVLRDESKFLEAFGQYQSSFTLAPTPQNASDGDSRGLAILHGKIADMLMAQGRLGDAAKELETNLEISQKLRDKFPKKGDLQHGVAVAHERLGFLRLKQRRWADAIEQYQEDLKVIDGLIESDSKNVTWLTDQAFANEGLGDVLRLRPNRNLQSALLYYKKYVEIVSSLTESDTSKSNVKLKRDLAVGYQRLGVTNLGMGLRDEARSDFQRCLSCSNGLVSPFDVRNPDPEDVREACRSQLESMTGK